MHLDDAHLPGDVLARPLYHSFSEVGGELRPGVGGDVDTRTERRTHVGGNLLDRADLHRAGDEDALLPVAVEYGEFDRNDRPFVFE